MKIKRFLSAFLIGSLLVSSIPCYAQEPQGEDGSSYDEFMQMIEQNKESFHSINNDDMFEIMKSGLKEGKAISLGEAFSMTEGLEIPSNFIYDISDFGLTGTLDLESINLQYANLITNMNQTYDTASVNLSSGAIGITDYFNSIYGDMKPSLDEVTLPEGLDFESLCNGMSEKMLEAYNSLQSEEFDDIRSRINVSALFDEAAKGLTTPELMDLSNLQDLTYKNRTQTEINWITKGYNEKNASYGQYIKNSNALNSANTTTFASDVAEQAKRRQEAIEKSNELLNKKKASASDSFKEGITTGNGAGYSAGSVLANATGKTAKTVINPAALAVGVAGKFVGKVASKFGNDSLGQSGNNLYEKTQKYVFGKN